MRKDTGAIPASSKIVLDNTPPEKGAKVHTDWLAKKKSWSRGQCVCWRVGAIPGALRLTGLTSMIAFCLIGFISRHLMHGTFEPGEGRHYVQHGTGAGTSAAESSC